MITSVMSNTILDSRPTVDYGYSSTKSPSTSDENLQRFVKAKRKINEIYKDLDDYVGKVDELIDRVPDELEMKEMASDILKDNKIKVNGIRVVLRRDHMKVVFFGRTSNGKSTTINALLRDRILPTGIGHTTSCFLQSRASIELRGFKYRVEASPDGSSYILTEDSDEHKKCDSISQLANALSTESLDPNAKILRGIDVEADLDEWIDKYCQDSDVFVLVANAESTLMITEKKFFHKVSERFSKPNIFILHNRSDAFAGEEKQEQVKAQHTNRAIKFLCDELGVCSTRAEAEDRIFFISAKEAIQARSCEDRGVSPSISTDDFFPRYLEFQNFEKKFTSCLSETAVKTKFATHTRGGVSLRKGFHFFTEDIEYKVGKAMNEEIQKLSVLVDEFEHPFHSDPTVLNVYKTQLNKYLESGVGSNLKSRLSTDLQMNIEKHQQEMIDRMTRLLPKERQQFSRNILPRRETFEVLYHLNCENLCSDFQEDIRFSPKQHSTNVHHSYSKTIFAFSLSFLAKVAVASVSSHGAMGSLLLGGFILKTVGWRAIALTGALYGGLYGYERLTWTAQAQAREFKRQYVYHAARKFRLIVDMTSANCSHQVQQELSSTFARLCHLVDETVCDINEDIKHVDEVLKNLNATAEESKVLKNKASYIRGELELFEKNLFECVPISPYQMEGKVLVTTVSSNTKVCYKTFDEGDPDAERRVKETTDKAIQVDPSHVMKGMGHVEFKNRMVPFTSKPVRVQTEARDIFKSDAHGGSTSISKTIQVDPSHAIKRPDHIENQNIEEPMRVESEASDIVKSPAHVVSTSISKAIQVDPIHVIEGPDHIENLNIEEPVRVESEASDIVKSNAHVVSTSISKAIQVDPIHVIEGPDHIENQNIEKPLAFKAIGVQTDESDIVSESNVVLGESHNSEITESGEESVSIRSILKNKSWSTQSNPRSRRSRSPKSRSPTVSSYDSRSNKSSTSVKSSRFSLKSKSPVIGSYKVSGSEILSSHNKISTPSNKSEIDLNNIPDVEYTESRTKSSKNINHSKDRLNHSNDLTSVKQLKKKTAKKASPPVAGKTKKENLCIRSFRNFIKNKLKKKKKIPGKEITTENISPGKDTTAESISPGKDSTAESISPGKDTTNEYKSPGKDTTTKYKSPEKDTTAEYQSPAKDIKTEYKSHRKTSELKYKSPTRKIADSSPMKRVSQGNEEYYGKKTSLDVPESAGQTLVVISDNSSEDSQMSRHSSECSFHTPSPVFSSVMKPYGETTSIPGHPRINHDHHLVGCGDYAHEVSSSYSKGGNVKLSARFAGFNCNQVNTSSTMDGNRIIVNRQVLVEKKLDYITTNEPAHKMKSKTLSKKYKTTESLIPGCPTAKYLGNAKRSHYDPLKDLSMFGTPESDPSSEQHASKKEVSLTASINESMAESEPKSVRVSDIITVAQVKHVPSE
ncbi:MFN2 [Lepeophtheirus salmonis]|uniref:MFN2 n=1 Tax=Lepeophtheirus salmonis TaxID=72036 RepID=A0A7R8CB54_LEPSM|nr:MFN2 [Lepeophtheirus salmonis]CAF2755140.1 MFN2 [Lepeophtheirus salmonis]